MVVKGPKEKADFNQVCHGVTDIVLALLSQTLNQEQNELEVQTYSNSKQLCRNSRNHPWLQNMVNAGNSHRIMLTSILTLCDEISSCRKVAQDFPKIFSI